MEPNKIVRYVKYRRKGEIDRKAAIVTVDFDVSGLSANEINVLGLLSDAVDLMNPIYVNQAEPLTWDLINFIENLMPIAEENTKENLKDYLTTLHIQNCPYGKISRKNNILMVDDQKVLAMIPNTPDPGKMFALFEKIKHLLYNDIKQSKYANLYPFDMKDEEMESLGEQKNRVNSRVARKSDRTLYIEINEEKFRQNLKPVIGLLQKAESYADNQSLKEYISAKIKELETGKEEDRIISDIAMIKNDSKICFNISTALEVYMDDAYNIRGAATGNVFVKDAKYEEFMSKLIKLMPDLERNAPWELKKEVDMSKLPKLSYVDVLNQSGDYIAMPSNTVAQSLPNEHDVKDKYGTVNFVYKNISKALYTSGGQKSAKEFLPKEIEEKYSSMFRDVSLIHHTTHELGHTTGRVEKSLQHLKPGELLKNGLYSSFEEARAELFSLYSLPALFDNGLITKDQMIAGYHNMVLGMVVNLKFKPTQAHTIARNMMFHYFVENGAIKSKSEGKTKFYADIEAMPAVVNAMLGIVGYFKGYGKTEEADKFKKEYSYSDELSDEVEERMKDFPIGRGLVFPKFVKDGSYKAELIYPEDYDEQEVFRYKIVDNISG